MIDTLPLDMFERDKDEQPTPTAAAPSAPPAPSAPAGAAPDATPVLRCQFCGRESPATLERCPGCGTRLSALGPPAGEPPASPVVQPAGPPAEAQDVHECQWCDAQLPPGATTCPKCGSKAPDPSLRLLGLNVPRPSDDVIFAPSSQYGDPGYYVSGNLAYGVLGTLLRVFGRGRR
jgi:ribosomal protein L40E